MRRLLYLLVLCLAFLCQNIEARETAGRVAETNDFYYNEHKQAGTMPESGSGHGTNDDEDGSGMDDSDDEDDDDDDEGSAMGATEEPKVKTCMERKQDVMESGLLGAYEPQCEEDGTYKKVQCHGSIGQCWCADSEGNRIESTQTRGKPNCEPMVYKYNIVAKFDLDFTKTVTNTQLYKEKIKRKLMKSFQKKFDNNSVKIMINSVRSGSVIVDFDLEVSGIQAKEPTTADLRAAVEESTVGDVQDFAATTKHATQPPTVPPEPTTKPTMKPMVDTTRKTVVITKVAPGGEDDNDKEEIDNVVPGAKGPKYTPEEGKEDDGQEDMETKEEETNEIGLEDNTGKFAASTGLTSSPGLLAGVIGGAVVGLLFAVLLVMFIVYRMRKKDEGSYALDEPKSPRLNTYTKASNKEFYA